MSVTGVADLNRLAAALSRVGENVPRELDRETQRWVLAGLARVKSNASGRPGPRRVTGDYTRTMNARFERSGQGLTGTIGTNAVQAMRLEFGFVGTDSLGRRYNQPPYPHWRPAFEWMTANVRSELPGVIAQAISAQMRSA